MIKIKLMCKYKISFWFILYIAMPIKAQFIGKMMIKENEELWKNFAKLWKNILRN